MVKWLRREPWMRKGLNILRLQNAIKIIFACSLFASVEPLLSWPPAASIETILQFLNRKSGCNGNRGLVSQHKIVKYSNFSRKAKSVGAIRHPSMHVKQAEGWRLNRIHSNASCTIHYTICFYRHLMIGPQRWTADFVGSDGKIPILENPEINTNTEDVHSRMANGAHTRPSPNYLQFRTWRFLCCRLLD